MKTWYFVAGEQVVTVRSYTVHDAWMKVAGRTRYPLASEFRTLPIEAYDADGIVIAKRSWQEWDEAVLRDTYGKNFRSILDHAADLL